MTKDEIIDWLVANETTTMQIILETNLRLTEPVDVLFFDEYKEQWNKEVTDRVRTEICKSMAIPVETIHECVDQSGLEQYLKQVENKNEKGI